MLPTHNSHIRFAFLWINPKPPPDIPPYVRMTTKLRKEAEVFGGNLCVRLLCNAMPKQATKIRLADTAAGVCVPHLGLSKQNQAQSNCFTLPQISRGTSSGKGNPKHFTVSSPSWENFKSFSR